MRRSRDPKTLDQGRRRLLAGCGAALLGGLPGGASAEPQGKLLDRRVISVQGESRAPRKALILTPKHLVREGGFAVVVLLHGLGETASEALGLRAWSDRYGLVDAEARLRRGEVTPEKPSRYLSAERARAMDEELHRRPYGGLVLVCPVTPNVYASGATGYALDRYADWITGALLPAVRETAPVRRDPAFTAIDGCSLGGYMALEVFLRKPAAFGALGGVQAAYGSRVVNVYAARLRAAIDRVGPRPIHIETSLWDPSLKAHRAMSERLHALGVDNDLTVLPGGHDQNFLREIGGLEMLLWHDRALYRRADPAEARSSRR